MKQENTTYSSLCPRCTITFGCGRDNISGCFCSKVEISDAKREEIASQYDTCLCPECLATLSGQANKRSVRTSGILGLLLFLASNILYAQTFPPAAGLPGSTAISKDSSIIIGWAKTCTVERGWMDITNQSLGKASTGDGSMGIGKALSNGVVSLGDAGAAICTFDMPINDGLGFDFAVFENSFDGFFLELAFVEVSSDGVNYFRFPSQSFVDTVNQTGTYANTDPRKINNLAGKYVVGYGTPFDLDELSGINGLNTKAVTHVKIIDVIGTLNPAFCSRDAQGRIINDPWPTDFASGGFDLDAVAVMHYSGPTGINELTVNQASLVFPNPLQQGENLLIKEVFDHFRLIDPIGNVVLSGNDSTINTSDLKTGVYFLQINHGEITQTTKILIY